MAINILAYYRFEGNTLDSSVHGNDGVMGVNVPAVSAGKMGRGYTFSRNANLTNSKYINSIPSNSINPPFFVSAWIYPTQITGSTTSAYSIFNRMLSGSRRGFLIISDSTVALGSQDGGNINISHAISANTWYHVVGVWGSSTSYLYVNGVLVGTSSVSFGGVDNDPTTIGALAYSGDINRGFIGIIDEVIIGRGEPNLSDIKRMMLGMHPLNIDPQL